MQKTFERMLVEQCAPTLAGMKTGSLFSYRARPGERVEYDIEEWNRKFLPRGIGIERLRGCGGRHLIYVYRKKRLFDCLHDLLCTAFLMDLGYDPSSTEACITFLKKRITVSEAFPHEIGLFLGYPLCDVRGFMQNKGKNFCCCGYWKVYADDGAARKHFARFKKCKAVYTDLFRKGKSAVQLTVSA